MFSPNEAQWPVAALTDTDTRRDVYFKLRPLAPAPNAQGAAIETRAIQIPRYCERLRQFTRTVRKSHGWTIPVAPLSHLLQPAQRLERADQYASGHSLTIRNDIQALMHPVDKVNVSSSGWPEYHSGAGSKAARSVGGEIVES